ncbi:MAG: hypothetical protein HYY37_03105 [Candidatus Aenigmarchaeota archaeon]|nr:hypothetical protein [Candidatus Aenigmarchaeota archaeon]
MLFFKKKSKEARPPPVEEIQRLSARGMSDKDIIKSLKSEGYSYDEIEQAMMQAVKEGVEPSAERPAAAIEQVYPSQAESQPTSDLIPELTASSMQEPMPEIEGMAPEAIVEELVEGVVEEKWQRFEERIKSVEIEIASLKQRAAVPQLAGQEAAAVDNTKAEALQDKLDDLEARIGGLEKAFKQFLPSLTRNIESLSRIIHEMKTRQMRPAV